MQNSALNLLHIEDDMQDAHLLKNSLKQPQETQSTYEIKQVVSMKDALCELSKPNGYNAILLDLNLPDGLGIKNIESLKNINSDIPIIIITGTNDEETALLALSEGAQEYIIKDYSNGNMLKRIIQSSIFRKRVERELSRKAYTDMLTGLPNRSFFEHTAQGMIRRAIRNDRQDALMFIDLNKFKQINDTLGHEAGNVVLKTVATRLKNILRESDLVARYAGDEFVIYLDSEKVPTTEFICRHLAEKIIKEIETPISIEGKDLEISLSIGIAVFPHAGKTFDELLKNADEAMYKAKNDSYNKFYIIGGREAEEKPPQLEKKLSIKSILSHPVNKNEPKNTILIIDDDTVDRFMYKKMLQKNKLKFNVIEANSMQEGLSAIETHNPDCVLLDYHLPDGRGIKCIKNNSQLRKNIDIPVIVVTGETDRKIAIQCMRDGARDYIIKDEINADSLSKVVLNVIEKNNLQKEIINYQKELERSNQELHEFAHMAAHDLKSPMRKIFMFSEILSSKKNDILDLEIHNYIDRISVNSGRMQTLINDLLEYSQITYQKEEKKFVSLDMIFQEIIEDLDVIINETKAKIKLGNLPEWPVYSTGARQLFLNLILNSIKYRNPEKPAIISISADVNHDLCTINIADNGVGITQDQKDKIFKPFHRLHSADDIEGTGLGLAICKKVIDKHQGRITVESIVGEGSTFKCSLPQ